MTIERAGGVTGATGAFTLGARAHRATMGTIVPYSGAARPMFSDRRSGSGPSASHSARWGRTCVRRATHLDLTPSIPARPPATSRQPQGPGPAPIARAAGSCRSWPRWCSCACRRSPSRRAVTRASTPTSGSASCTAKCRTATRGIRSRPPIHCDLRRACGRPGPTSAWCRHRSRGDRRHRRALLRPRRASPGAGGGARRGPALPVPRQPGPRAARAASAFAGSARCSSARHRGVRRVRRNTQRDAHRYRVRPAWALVAACASAWPRLQVPGARCCGAACAGRDRNATGAAFAARRVCSRRSPWRGRVLSSACWRSSRPAARSPISTTRRSPTTLLLGRDLPGARSTCVAYLVTFPVQLRVDRLAVVDGRPRLRHPARRGGALAALPRRAGCGWSPRACRSPSTAAAACRSTSCRRGPPLALAAGLAARVGVAAPRPGAAGHPAGPGRHGRLARHDDPEGRRLHRARLQGPDGADPARGVSGAVRRPRLGRQVRRSAIEELAAYVRANSAPTDRVLVFGFSPVRPGAGRSARSASRFFWSRPRDRRLPRGHARLRRQPACSRSCRARSRRLVVLQRHDWDPDGPDS